MKTLASLKLALTFVALCTLCFSCSPSDRVASYNLESNRLEYRDHGHIHEHVDTRLVIECDNGRTYEWGANEKIYIVGKGWKRYSHDPLAFTGDAEVITVNDAKAKPTKIERAYSDASQIILSVPRNVTHNRNFFANGLLVHNCSSGTAYILGVPTPVNYDCYSSYCSSSSSFAQSNPNGQIGEGSTGGGTTTPPVTTPPAATPPAATPPATTPPDTTPPDTMPPAATPPAATPPAATPPAATPPATTPPATSTPEPQKCSGCNNTSCTCSSDASSEVAEQTEAVKDAAKAEENSETDKKNNATAVAEAAKEGTGKLAGDPVRVTTGDFVLSETDFIFTRTWTSGKQTSGSLGEHWFFSPDTRLIRGVSSRAGIECVTVKGINDSLAKFSENIEKYVISTSEKLGHQIIISGLVKQCGDALERLSKEANEAVLIREYNTAPINSSLDTFFTGTGNGTMVLIDESGNPLVFDEEETGTWKPALPERKHEYTLTSIDGKGSAEAKGFILSDSRGNKTEFNEKGLLTGKTIKGFSSLKYTRDDDGKLLYVKDHHGASWKFNYGDWGIDNITDGEGRSIDYTYDGGILSGIRDIAGNATAYEWKEEHIAKVIKADQSYVEIIWGLVTDSGKKMVTQTISEEGHPEYFDYDLVNRKTTHTDYDGTTILYEYDEQNRITRESGGASGEIVTAYAGNYGESESVTVNGRTTVYGYDERRNLILALYDDETADEWQYDSTGSLVSWTDRDGTATEYQYDDYGNVTSIIRSGIQVYDAAYLPNTASPLREKIGNRQPVTYTHDKNGRIASRTVDGITERWTYDSMGGILYYTNGSGITATWVQDKNKTTIDNGKGLITVLAYDNRNDLVKKTEEDSHTGEIRTKTYTWNNMHLPLSETDDEGLVAEWSWTKGGKLESETRGEWVKTYKWNDEGKLAKTTTAYKGKSIEEIRTYERVDGLDIAHIHLDGTRFRSSFNNANGLPVITMDGEGNTETFDWTGTRKLTGWKESFGAEHSLTRSADGLTETSYIDGEVKTVTVLNPDGTIHSLTDIDGTQTLYEYNDRGLPIKVTEDRGETVLEWDAVSRVTKATVYERGKQLEDVSFTRSPDARHVVKSEGGLYESQISYNAWGETVSSEDGNKNITRFELDKRGRVKTIVDPYGRKTAIVRNAIGLPTSVTYPDGSINKIEYDIHGETSRITDSLGEVYTAERDDAGRIIREWSRMGTETEYTYDTAERLISTVQNGEITQRYSYDNENRIMIREDASGNKHRWTLDSQGRIIEEINRLGLITRIDPEEYKKKDEDIERNAAGRIVQATGESGTLVYEYDAGGRLTKSTDLISGEVVRYYHDKAGYITRTLAGDRDIHFVWGKNAELLRISDSATGMSIAITYDLMGRETARIFGNGTRQETVYDKAGRIILVKESDSRGNLLRGEGYVYGADGKKELSVDHTGAVTRYIYDERGRVSAILYPWSKDKARRDEDEGTEHGVPRFSERETSESMFVTSDEGSRLMPLLAMMLLGGDRMLRQSQAIIREEYEYDANGNIALKRTSWGELTFTYDAEDRLLSAGKTQFTYDGTGNLTEKKSLWKNEKYTYNEGKRMATVSITDEKTHTSYFAEYAYDAFGRRTTVAENGVKSVRALYAGFGFDVLSFKETSLTVASNGAVTGGRYRYVESAVSTKTSSYPRYPLSLGGFATAEAVYGEVSYFGTDSLGSIRSVSDVRSGSHALYEYDAFGSPLTSDAFAYGFAGKPWCADTGLSDYGFRDYSPALARFTTEDPIRDGTNWHTYASNDPVNFVDLWGLLTGENPSTYKVPTDFYSQFNRDSMKSFWPTGTPGGTLGTTSCNTFLPALTKKLSEDVYKDIFTNGTKDSAKQLYTTFKNNPNLTEIEPNGTNIARAKKAQELANQNYLVISALETDGTGHVSAVGPQTLNYSSYPSKPWSGHAGTGPRQTGNGTGNNVLRDYPVFVQGGAYTGVVEPGYAQGRPNLTDNKVHYFIYTPKE